MKLIIFAYVLGAQALPQWLNGLKRDLAYAPAAYNPVYGPRDGVESFTYGGYGPQPTVVTTSSSTSTSEASGITTSTSSTSSITLPSASETSLSGPIYARVANSFSTTTSSISTISIGTTSVKTSSSSSIISIANKPLVCNHDNCLRQFLRTPAVTAFCATYTKADNTATTGLPSFVSHCSGAPSRISSACSCLPTLAPSVSTSSTTTLFSNSMLLSTETLHASSSSMSTSTTISTVAGVEPTTTTITHVTVTSPITIWYTPPANMGTGSSGIPSSPAQTSAPYSFSNQTSLVGPTGTGLSSSSLRTLPMSSTVEPTSPVVGTVDASNSSTVPTRFVPYPMSNSTSGMIGTGSSSGTAPIMTASNSSYHNIPTRSHSHYHSDKSLSVIPTGATTSCSGSRSYPSSTSDVNPYFPMSNISSIFGTSPTASGSYTSYLSAGNSSFSIGPTATGPNPSTPSNSVNYTPIYPLANSSSIVGAIGTYSASPNSTATLNSSTREDSPTIGSSTPYYSIVNTTSNMDPVGISSISSQSSPAVVNPSSILHSTLTGNSSSFQSLAGTSLQTISSNVFTTAILATAVSSSYDSPLSTGASSPLSSYLSSFGPYSNSSSPTASTPISASSSTTIIPTMPVHVLPTHHQGHHNHHGEHYDDGEHGEEIDLFFKET